MGDLGVHKAYLLPWLLGSDIAEVGAFAATLDKKNEKGKLITVEDNAVCILRMANGVLQPRGDTMVEPRMDVQNVADAIVFMATRSLDANALFLNIMATKMPFVGRG